ncbi:CDP-alcohol phosphatidyltransferase family protein [Xylophilus sp. GOD-11R]|uniref:CDP-alcohol phosphatidyltransferase family protein n=1 Tax=Xylophilus sp. GOD-11R TaxID=3089814 RepID=UPI00298CC1FB|nr:CDP-alcohol phosphatidyltransferase family protein [Xylophilus sp. GOD-11R]WPB58952.1 CDP-alcohol phosphatidyltransferase family protein [Xylophilus sp. GOD-11R]
MTSAERIQRQLKRANADAMVGAADRSILLRADWIFDEALVRGLARSTSDVALRAPEGDIVAVSVGAAGTPDALALLAAGKAPADAHEVSAVEIADNYNDKLRKREPPYLLRLTEDNLPAIERRTFAGAYKGVTDLVTLYAWPRPARYVTKVCANAGITPNQVTSLSLVMVLAAMWAFWTGHYAWGLVAAWIMTFLDTVDGKLARVTLRSSRFGDFFDHSIDLVHPPFWWWAWIVGLPAVGLPLQYATAALVAIVAGYILQRVEEGVFIACFGIEMHVWRRFDSWFRLITARRNPNLLLLTASVIGSRPDIGIYAVAIWTVLCLGVHAVQLVQAAAAKRGGALRSWLASPQ